MFTVGGWSFSESSPFKECLSYGEIDVSFRSRRFFLPDNKCQIALTRKPSLIICCLFRAVPSTCATIPEVFLLVSTPNRVLSEKICQLKGSACMGNFLGIFPEVCAHLPLFGIGNERSRQVFVDLIFSGLILKVAASLRWAHLLQRTCPQGNPLKFQTSKLCA